MGDPVAFHKIDGAPQTLLCRTFAAPRDVVFDVWTDAETLQKWWGPRVATVVHSEMDLREGGAYRITMAMPDGRWYPMFGTVHDIAPPFGYSLRVRLGEHPDDWLESFRPKGTELEDVPMEWFYEISFAEEGDSTAVDVLATYPVMQDRDAMISMGGEVGWNESFEKLDSLLARGRRQP